MHRCCFTGCWMRRFKASRGSRLGIQPGRPALSSFALFEGDLTDQSPPMASSPMTSTTPPCLRLHRKTPRHQATRRWPHQLPPDEDFRFSVGTVIAKTFAYPHDMRNPGTTAAACSSHCSFIAPTAGSACRMSGTIGDGNPRRPRGRHRLRVGPHRRRKAAQQLPRAQLEPVQTLPRSRR